MRIAFLALVGAVCSYPQPSQVVDTGLSPEIECTGRVDGYYASGCTNRYFSCVAGLAYPFDCPEGLVFDAASNICDYPDVCGTTIAPENAESESYIPAEDGVDCSAVADGFYAPSCSPTYTVCSYGTSTSVSCPDGLLFDQSTASCEYAEACGKMLHDSRSEELPIGSTAVSQSKDYAFECLNNDEDGFISLGCVNEYVRCDAGASYVFYCPAGLVFDGISNRCDYSCEHLDDSRSTVIPTTDYYSTAQPSTYTPDTTTYMPITTTRGFYQTSPSRSTPRATFCTIGNTATIGDCSSKFRRCRNGQWVGARCPGATVFDDSIGLCVYDLPRCHTNLLPKKKVVSEKLSYSSQSQQSYEPAAYVTAYPAYAGYSPVDSSPQPGPRYQTPVDVVNDLASEQYLASSSVSDSHPVVYGYEQEEYVAPTANVHILSNPFFAYRRSHHSGKHGKKHARSDDETSGRILKGKLKNKSLGIRIGGHENVEDSFSGKKSHVIYASSQDMFPHGHGKRNRISIEKELHIIGKHDTPELDIQDNGETATYDDLSKLSQGSLAESVSEPSIGDTTTTAAEGGSLDESSESIAITLSSLESSGESTTSAGNNLATSTQETDGELPSSTVLALDVDVTEPVEEPSSSSDIETSTTEMDSDIDSNEEVATTNGESVSDHFVAERDSTTTSTDNSVSTDIGDETTESELFETDDSDEDYMRRKRSSGYGPVSTDEDFICTTSQSGTLVAIGTCRQDFVYCRSAGNGVVAACPLGELFDSNLHRCVSTFECGENASSEYDVETDASDGNISVINTERPYNAAYTTPASSYDVEPSTSTSTSTFASADVFSSTVNSYSSVQRFDACDGREDGPLSLGCSVNYLICQNGVGIERFCPDGLVYNEGLDRCEYEESVAACGGNPVNDAVAEPVYVDQDRSEPFPYHPESPIVHQPAAVHYTTVASTFEPTSSDVAASNRRAVPYKVQTTTPSIIYRPPNVFPYSPQPTPSGMDTSKVSCVGIDGYYAVSHCSGSYVYCRNNKIAAVMNCPTGLIYDNMIGQCSDTTSVDSCTDSFVGHTQVMPESTAAYPSHITEVSIAEPIPETKCADAISAIAGCSSKYRVCSEGINYEQSCPSPLVFSSSSRSCEYKEFVAECSSPADYSSPSTTVFDYSIPSTTVFDYSSPPTTASDYSSPPTTASDYSSPSTAVSDYSIPPTAVAADSTTITTSTEPSTAIYVSTTKISPRCVDGNKIAVAFCGLKYRVCNSDGDFVDAECTAGLLFEPARGKCVPASVCGQQHREIDNGKATTNSDVRCAGQFNDTLISLSRCSEKYIRCFNGVPLRENCDSSQVFSTKRGRCVRRHLSPECGHERIEYVTVSNDRTSFCTGRVDGLYKDPSDCAGVLQCFGGEMFVHEGCTSGLVFNEKSRQCDYRQNVPGCEEAQRDAQMETGCRGAEHGAYIASESDCTVFFRCVWNRLERMHCPTGTVFNPTLSVCDWPAAVPHCMS